MCQPVIQFCSGSAKPLLFAGSFLLLLLAIAIGYLGCTANRLYQDIDPSVAQDKSWLYYLQLVVTGYLSAITAFASFAAYKDQKHSIRALAVITSLNFVLAAVAILLIPSGSEVSGLFEKRLSDARPLYNYTERPQQALNQAGGGNGATLPSAGVKLELPKMRAKRFADPPPGASDAKAPSTDSSAKAVQQITVQEATALWDKLQCRGCCGFKANTEWTKSEFPKSCCSKPIEKDGKTICDSVDDKHNQPCKDIIEDGSQYLLIVLALIALINLYLATVTGISTYRTFHYDEASQNAYT